MADVCISTVVDRSALQSVYTSKMKKTVTPLDEARLRARDARGSIVNNARTQRDDAHDERAAHCRMFFASIAEHPMKYGLFATVVFCCPRGASKTFP
jgi:hypothetical protein